MKVPLSQRLRPQSFEDFVGQTHLLQSHGFLQKTIKAKNPLSIILWGPPGCGKTSLAQLYAQAFDARFVSLSAVFAKLSDLKKIIEESEKHELLYRQTLVFVDEIHRLNKAQQDAFLPYLEKGTFILVGATTENPSFSLNNALISRLRILELQSLNEKDLNQILDIYEKKVAHLPLRSKAKKRLVHEAKGDARYLLNLIENIENSQSQKLLDLDDLETLLQKRPANYDKQGELHYKLISALHKSIRGSDPDAALYWLARMLQGGEDPLFIARRMIRMASEDIGMADPQALSIAVSAKASYEHLGSPEGELALAQSAVYLATAPKSNAVYTAWKEAQSYAEKSSHLDPPKIIVNAPTQSMKDLGYAQGYIYDHDTPQGISGQNYFPQKLDPKRFYRPVKRGFERDIQKRIDFFHTLRKKEKPS